MFEGPHARSSGVYSFNRLSDNVLSVGWELAVVGGALVAVGLRDWDWGGSKFAFIEEGWFASNTRHGGMDKIGHAFSTYVIADLLTDRILANASDPTGAQITGALLAFGIMGAGETVDGFTGKHRFSREDIVANAIGAAFSIFRNSIPGLREKLDFRFMYTPASYERAGITPSEFQLHPALRAPALHHGAEGQRFRRAEGHASALFRTAGRLRCTRVRGQGASTRLSN